MNQKDCTEVADSRVRARLRAFVCIDQIVRSGLTSPSEAPSDKDPYV